MQKAKGINLNENQIKCSNNYTIFGYLIGIILVYSTYRYKKHSTGTLTLPSNICIL